MADHCSKTPPAGTRKFLIFNCSKGKMKSFIVGLVILCVAVTAGTIIYLNRQKAPPTPTPVVESPPRQTEQTPPEKIAAPKQEQPRTVSEGANEPAQVPVTNSASDNMESGVATTFSKAIDTLISPQTSFSDRQALLKQLKNAGELDSAIAELKQRAASIPNDPKIPTALGEALLNKFPVQDHDEAAQLGMQIDQNFNTALALDPANWEAEFFKADSMSYWPPEANKSPEVIQRLSSLIDQQETMTPQSQFAQTYVLLGDQYQKAGQSAYAQTTWQLGLAKFPSDPTLQNRIATQ
jgi:hypothetical protein